MKADRSTSSYRSIHLIEVGARAYAPTDVGKLAILVLWTACSFGLIAACGSGNAGGEPAGNQTANTVTERPAELPAAVRLAIEEDDVAALREYLDGGGDPNAITGERNAPAMQVGAIRDDSKCMRLLLERGADVNQPDDAGWTPLAFAVAFHANGNVRYLLDHGARQSAVTEEGWSALRIAVMRGLLDTAELLLESGAEPLGSAGGADTPLHVGARGASDNSPEVTKLLLRYIETGTDIDVLNDRKTTPLMEALMARKSQTVRLLLEAGADPTVHGDRDFPVLWHAARCDDAVLFGMLIEAGADPNYHDHENRTPLHAAAEFGVSAVLEELLVGGADPNAQDSNGDTPLHLAAQGEESGGGKVGFAKCVKLLLGHGADRSIKNNERKTPLDVAYWLDVEVLLKNDG